MQEVNRYKMFDSKVKHSDNILKFLKRMKTVEFVQPDGAMVVNDTGKNLNCVSHLPWKWELMHAINEFLENMLTLCFSLLYISCIILLLRSYARDSADSGALFVLGGARMFIILNFSQYAKCW